MNTWLKPVATTYDLVDMAVEVKAKAWSPEQENPDVDYNINDYLDEAYEGYEAWFYDDDYGVQVSARCIGTWMLGGLIVKELLFSDGTTRTYWGTTGSWSLLY